MRLFEAAAAGALIITDDFEFPREWFRDSVLYIDAELPAPMVIEQIVSYVEWANRNPEPANRLAHRSNELFRRCLTLESMLRPLPEFVDLVRDCRCMVVVHESKEKSQPTVEYIVRIGSRPATTLARALDSLAAQTYQAVAVILVQFHPIAGLCVSTNIVLGSVGSVTSSSRITATGAAAGRQGSTPLQPTSSGCSTTTTLSFPTTSHH